MLCIFFAIITIYFFFKKKRKKKSDPKEFFKIVLIHLVILLFKYKNKTHIFFLNDLLIILYTIGEKVSLQKNIQIFFFLKKIF